MRDKFRKDHQIRSMYLTNPKMQRNTFISLFRCTDARPLESWVKKARNGHIKRVKDDDVHAQVLEICGTNINTAFIRCPAKPEVTMDVQLPCLVLIMKNLNSQCAFEVQVVDDQMVRRRFRATTEETCVQSKPFLCTLPLHLDDGWNRVQLDLGHFTRRVYATKFVQCLRVQIQANCRLRQVYFTERMHSEDTNHFDNSLPPENSPSINGAPKPGPNGPAEQKAQSFKGPIQRRHHSSDRDSYVPH